MIILGGSFDRHDAADVIQSASDDLNSSVWPSVKRAHGAHRIASYLRNEGYDVEVLDFWPAWSPIQILKFFHQRVREDTICIGLSVLFPLSYGVMGKDKKANAKVAEMLQTIKRLKEMYPNIPFVGGSHNISALIEYDLDYYVTGYGEYAITELLKYFKKEFNMLQMTKQLYRGVPINIVEATKDYPAYPMPNANVSYEDRDYIQPQEVLSLELSRGCKFKCKFCSFPVLGVRGDFSRCIDSLREELIENYERWGIDTYSVNDETINDSPDKLAKYAKLIKTLPFKLKLQGFMRADLMVAHPETWQDIWDMGLHTHYYGLETLNRQAGSYVGKGMKPEVLKEGMIKMQQWFKDRGPYRCQTSMIIGLPGETRETFFEGLKWVKENLDIGAYSISPLYIAGGTIANMLSVQNSVFERTWREEGVIRETTNEEMGVDFSELDEETAHFALPLESNAYLKWQHDTMNIWEAFKIFEEVVHDDELKQDIGPGVFYYHRYLSTNKYTIDDIFNKNIEPYGNDDLDRQEAFINKYIEKKLSN